MSTADEDQVARFMLGHMGEEAAVVAAAIEAEAALRSNESKAMGWQRIGARILAICAVEGPFRAPDLTVPPKKRRRRPGVVAGGVAAPVPAPLVVEPSQTAPTRVSYLRLVVG